jgi:serine/threonine-protein kinase
MLADLEDYAASARMIASEIRFGEWLMEHFGQDVVRDRRARERVVRALALGPAAVIRPIVGLPDYDATPSAFPVALRADPEEEAPAPPPEAAPAPLAPAPRAQGGRLVAYALVLATLAYAALRLLMMR